jgi:hypothetical protein
LVCVLLGLYLLILLPAPDSIDGEALAAVAIAWVRSGSPNMNGIVSHDALFPLDTGRMGSAGVDGAIYSKKGVTPSIFLSPLVILSDLIRWLTTRPTLMLFNSLITVATALLLYRFAAALGCRLRTALAVGFSFGAATFAFAYAKSLFGEPLAALLLLIAVMAIHQRDSVRNMAVAGAAIGLLIGINMVYAAFAPIIALLIALRWRNVRALIPYGIPIAAALLLIGLYNLLRFGSPLSSGYQFSAEGFVTPIGVGLYGLFLSPYRGLFWYSPLLLLAIPSWLMLRRSQRWLAWTILVLVVAQGLAFAGWWSWHGGVVWAPRFLVPILPLLTLALSPLIEAVWKRWALLVIFGAFFSLSAFIACLGAFYSFFPFHIYLNACCAEGDFLVDPTDELLFNPFHSPIIGHLAMLSAGMPLEPAWFRTGDWSYLLLPGVLIVGGVAQLFLNLSQRARILSMLGVALIALKIAVIRKSDYALRETFETAFTPAGTVVAATASFQTALFDVRQHVPMISMPAPSEPDDQKVSGLWDFALRQRSLLWFVNWFPPSSPENWQERALFERAAFVTERQLLHHRALLFHIGSDPAEVDGGWRFGAVALDAYGVDIHPQGVRVLLRWSAASPTKRLSWFVHLVDGSGRIVAQQDRQPLGGYAPTETWLAERSIVDRLFFLAEPDVNTWRLRVGWVDPDTAALLPVTDRSGQPLPEPFVMLPLTIQPD